MSSPHCVPDYHALRNLAPPTSSLGPHLPHVCEYVFVSGYPDPQNSGLQGFFEWRAHSLDADNGGTVIKPNAVLAHSQGRWHRVFRGDISVKWFGAKGDGVSHDSDSIQAAVDAAAGGRGTVLIDRGNYLICADLQLASNTRIRGEGQGATVLTGGPSLGNVFQRLGASGIVDFSVQDLTLNLNNTLGASGIRVEYASRGLFRDLHILNVASGGWGVVVGVTDRSDSAFRNQDIMIENVVFDAHDGTLEQLLLMNSQRVQVLGCSFSGTTGGGPAIGLFQNLLFTGIQRCTFRNLSGAAIYYSLSCDHTSIMDCLFLGAGPGIQGANQSDNGTFGNTVVHGLRVEACYFTGLTTGCQLGACDDARILNCTFESNQRNALVIDGGNTPVPAQPSNWRIIGCTFKNNNTEDSLYGIHPGLLLQSIAGPQYGIIADCSFYDDQVRKTQRYPITFDGHFVWDFITIVNNRLSPDVVNAGVPILLGDFAALGGSVITVNNME
jgi:hypothetical protein